MIRDGFSITLAGAQSSPVDRPDDPLDELEPVDLGIKLFCYDNNRKCTIQAGEIVLDCELYPDISMSLEEVPGVLRSLHNGIVAGLAFESISRQFIFSPTGDNVSTTYRAWGYHHETRMLVLSGDGVVHELEKLLDWVLTSALSKGYITAADVAAYQASH